MHMTPPVGAVKRQSMIEYVGRGAAAVGTSSLSVPYGTGVAAPLAGDIALLTIANKYPANSPAAPTGYTLAHQSTGGAGGSGVDSGNVYSTTYYRVCDGSESGNVAVTITSGNAAVARISTFRCNVPGLTWSIAASGGGQNTGSLTWSVAAAADPGIKAKDMVVAAGAANTDNGGVCLAENATLTAAGIKSAAGIQINNGGTTQADDAGLTTHAFVCASGQSTGVPTYTCVYTSVTPAGAVSIIRLRCS